MDTMKSTNDSSNYLEIQNVTMIFNEDSDDSCVAVKDISFTVKKGDFVTILGPSGCGKTTTLRMVGGFIKQTSGTIKLNGKPIDNVETFNRNMPMVFQNFALFPHLNVFDNISYGLKIRKVPNQIIKNEVAMICCVMNLVGLENRFPGDLSGGQQQRVSLARALVLKPSMILFDEPLSNLDAKLRIQTRIEIKKIQKLLGITALYVTHDQAEALSVSDQIIVMNRGKIIQIGTPAEIYHNPKTPFVADFIGNSNFLEAKISEINGNEVTLCFNDKFLIVKKNAIDFIEGEQVFLAIKPEAITFSKEETDFSAVIDIISFLGTTIEYKLKFENSFITVIQFNTSDIAKKQYTFGDKVYLKFDEQSFNIYKS